MQENSIVPEASVAATAFVVVPAVASSPAARASGQWELVDFQPVVGTGAAAVFQARCADTDQQVELRLLPWLDTAASQQKLLEQDERARRILGRQARPMLTFLTEELPVRIVHEPQAESLEAYLQNASVDQRLTLILRLIEIIENAILGGVCHGALDSACIEIQDGEPRLDFLRRFYSPLTCHQAQDSDKDLLDLAQLIETLLEPVFDQADFRGRLNGQQRGQLRNLRRAGSEGLTPWDLVDHWTELLRGIHTSISSDAPSSLSSEPTPREFVLPQDLSDATDEIDIRSPFPRNGEVKDDMNQEIEGSVDSAHRFGGGMPRIGDALGRYQLGSILGQGGMGVVYHAIDSETSLPVALKVLRPLGQDVGQAIRRFRKEARLLAMVQNPHVVKILESGIESGFHFIAMEFVEGPNLRSWLSGRGTLEESTALKLISEIAQALVEAHEAEIVHRDIKPENVLLESGTDHASTDKFNVKLTDFGVARTRQQTASMEMTKAGSLLGTPTYMAPEQFRNSSHITPAADIYSLGITLFVMLAGRAPYDSDDPMKLAAMHYFEDLPDVRRFSPTISDATVGLLNRMLAKQPEQRPADANQLIREIERMHQGEAADFEGHARPTGNDSEKIWKKQFQWELESSPQALWPLVSNTERLNRASGLQSVQYRTEKDPNKGLRRFGSFRLGMVSIEWEEHPFEWIEGRKMGILREFQTGPFVWFLSQVELSTTPSGKTLLTHTVEIEPRHVFGRMIAQVEAGWKGGKALDRIYTRIDRSLQREADNPFFDPFETPEALDGPTKKRLEQRMDAMHEHGVDLEVAEKLAEFLRTAAPQSLAQIRPVPLADQLGVSSDTMVDACLVAAHCGLLNVRWDVLCPTCRAPASATTFLSEIDQHTDCEACDTAFRSDLASAIELVFQAHPEIRRFDDAQYCIGGPEHSPHVVAQVRLEPGESLELDVPLTAGEFLLRQSAVPGGLPVQVRSQAAPSRLALSLTQLNQEQRTPAVRAGIVNLTLSNDTSQVRVVRLERTIARQNVVTAATASALPRFRELFPAQVFRREQAVASEELTLLETRIACCETLYSELSELDAYQQIQKTIEFIETQILAHRGAVIKSVDDRLVASFPNSSDAARCALELPIQLLQQDALTDLSLGVAIHRGPLLVTTQNGRLDYFGETARQVHTLCEAMDDAIAFCESVLADSEVAELLSPHTGSSYSRMMDLSEQKKKLITVLPWHDLAEDLT